MAPLVVHLVEMPAVSFASQSNEKITFDERANALLDAHPPVSTFQKKAKVSIDDTEPANKIAKTGTSPFHKGLLVKFKCANCMRSLIWQDIKIIKDLNVK